MNERFSPSDRSMPSTPEAFSGEKLSELSHGELIFAVQALQGQVQRMREKIAENDETIKALREKAFFDEMTDVLNRSGLEEYFKNLEHDDEEQLAVICIDVNGLKQLNDNEGHEAGDKYITNIAQVLASSVRKDDDIVARTGGDEFVILAFAGEHEYSGETGHVDADAVLRRIREKVDEQVTAINAAITEQNESSLADGVEPVKVSFSAGAVGTTVGRLREEVKTRGSVVASEQVQEADKKMYSDKDKHYKRKRGAEGAADAEQNG
ncbi:hypothetical protein CR983_00330 [Candidatus Saccharibacteria bacterium]|nr:MAG: hypothetical protein CR983_00330 [Candidatus Saccharibacteria bacterium]